ncbi:MAG: LCP family protein [bacterium]
MQETTKNDDVIILVPEDIKSTKVSEKIEDSEQKEIKFEAPAKRKKFPFAKIISAILILVSLSLLGFGSYFGLKVYNTASNVIVNDGANSECKNLLSLSCLNLQTPFTQKKELKLKGQEEGRTNILIIGADSAAGLSDTMILLSYFWNEKKVVTLNIPRDTYVNTTFQGDGGTYRINEKLNALFPYAENASDKPGNGSVALAAFISTEFNIPIHYWIMTNFRAFKDVVNELGGVDVNVDKAFTDCTYPTDGYTGYIRPCPSFKVGPEKMDGTRALIYARSRHSLGDPLDFARSRRQSILIQSVAKTAKSKGIFGNINNIYAYLKIIGDNVKTNIQLNEMLVAYKESESFDFDNGFLRVIWQEGNGILCRGKGEAYTLIYCGGQVPGTSGNSFAKQKAVNSVQNLLSLGQPSQQ